MGYRARSVIYRLLIRLLFGKKKTRLKLCNHSNHILGESRSEMDNRCNFANRRRCKYISLLLPVSRLQ